MLPFIEACELVREWRRAHYCKPIEEITEERFDDMLNVLPPENWQRGGGLSIFRMSEYMTGSITGHYLSMQGRYFHAYREAKRGTYEAFITEAQAFIDANQANNIS